MSSTSQTPAFLWDREISPDRFRTVVNDPTAPEHDAWLALMLREARPDEVWNWTTPDHVAAHVAALSSRLGRREAFWVWLIEGWRGLGLLQ